MQASLKGWIARTAVAGAAAAVATVALPFVLPAAAATTPQVSVDDASVIEGDSGPAALQFHVTLDQAAETSTSVNVRTTSAGSATAGADFDAQDITITFLPGTVTSTLAVPVHGDLAGEPDETVGIELYDPTGVTIAPDAKADGNGIGSARADDEVLAPAATDGPDAAADGNGIGTIVNDDPVPAVSVDDASVTEGNTGVTTMGFHLTLDQPAKQSVNVRFRTTSGTGAVGTDYEPVDLTVTFVAGAVTAQVDVVVHGDTTFESDETFGVLLSDPVGVTIADGSGTGTILDDDPDPSPPTATISDAQVIEGDDATATLSFQVTLSETSRHPVTVTATTSDGTATSASGDYTAASTTVTFPANTTRAQVVSVGVTGDDDVETDETVIVTLSNPDWATLSGDATGIGSIINDDADVAFAAPTASLDEGPAGATNTVVLTANLSTPLPVEVTVPLSTVAGTATEGDDYQPFAPGDHVTFPAGTTNASIPVVVTGDDVDEPDETFTVVLGGQVPADRAASGAQGGAEAVVTIADDDLAATTTSTSTTTPTASATTTTSTANGSYATTGTGGTSLPSTGSSAGNLTAVGLILLGAGLVVRRFGLARRSAVG